MSDNQPAKKRAHIVKNFTDAGTGESFTADSTPMLEAGAFANYHAAGLVRTPTADPKPAVRPKRPAKAKPTAKVAAKPEDAKPQAPAAEVLPAA